jgi:hypothetical protein
MSIIDTGTNAVKKWVFSIGIKKGTVSLAKLITSYCTAKGIAFVGTISGIPVDVNDVLIMTAAINSVLKVFFNWLKTKYPSQFAFL